VVQRLSTNRAAGPGTLLTFGPVLAALALGYVALLHYVYVVYIAPLFTYLQYGYRTPDPFGYGVALALVAGLAMLMPRRITHPSHFIVWVLFIITVIPSLVVPQWAPALSYAEALELTVWVGACFAFVVGLGTRQLLRDFVPRYPLPAQTYRLLIIGAFVVLLAYAVYITGINFSPPSLDDVYGVRAEYREETVANPALGYVVPLLTGLINPLMMALGLWERRPVWVILGMLGQLYAYAGEGNKSAFFSPLAIGLAFLLVRRRRPMVGAGALLGAMVVVVVAIAIGWTSLFVRRFLITPGLVTAGFVQVFDNAPKAHLGHSILSRFVDYPYSDDPADVVGRWFFGNPATHANTGWLGDGFANFGYPGMLAASVILVFVLWTIDDAAKGMPLGFACLFFLPHALTLCESAILTAILTHGIFAAIVLAALAPRDGWARSGLVVGDDHPTGRQRSRVLTDQEAGVARSRSWRPRSENVHD
jgi:hypothetical protein